MKALNLGLGKKFRRCVTYIKDEPDEDSVASLVQKNKVSQKTCNDIDPNPNEISTTPPNSSQIQIQTPGVLTQLETPQSSSSPLSHSPPACSSGKCNS